MAKDGITGSPGKRVAQPPAVIVTLVDNQERGSVSTYSPRTKHALDQIQNIESVAPTSTVVRCYHFKCAMHIVSMCNKLS